MNWLQTDVAKVLIRHFLNLIAVAAVAHGVIATSQTDQFVSIGFSVVVFIVNCINDHLHVKSARAATPPTPVQSPKGAEQNS